MLTALIKPKTLWIGLAIQTFILIAVFSNILIGGAGKLDNFAIFVPFVTDGIAYITAGALNFKISTEYKNNNLLRFGWMFLGMNAFISIARNSVGLPSWDLIWAGFYNSQAAETSHRIIIIIANLFLFLGLSVMWFGFKEANLGFTIGRRGYIEIVCIAILTTALLLTVSDPHPIGLVILSAAAIVSVVLHKMALQMGGGKLATTLRFLTLYTLMRATLVLIEHLIGLNNPERRQNIDWIMAIDLVVWRFIPWIAALAAAYRVELTVHATKELSRSENVAVSTTV